MNPKAQPHTTLALLRSSSLASAVQQEIERAILRGELAPGAKLNEAELAEPLPTDAHFERLGRVVVAHERARGRATDGVRIELSGNIEFPLQVQKTTPMAVGASSDDD